MVVVANSTTPRVTTNSPPGKAEPNAEAVRLAPDTPDSSTPVNIMTSPVIVQTTSVSIKVPSIATSPCSTGSLVLAAAWAIGALPSPASLENIPRATPKRIAAQTVAPAKPPAADAPLNALSMMVASAPGTSSMCRPITIKLMST